MYEHSQLLHTMHYIGQKLWLFSTLSFCSSLLSICCILKLKTFKRRIPLQVRQQKQFKSSLYLTSLCISPHSVQEMLFAFLDWVLLYISSTAPIDLLQFRKTFQPSGAYKLSGKGMTSATPDIRRHRSRQQWRARWLQCLPTTSPCIYVVWNAFSQSITAALLPKTTCSPEPLN